MEKWVTSAMDFPPTVTAKASGFEPRAFAFRAEPAAHEPRLNFLFHESRFGFFVTSFQIPDDAFKLFDVLAPGGLVVNAPVQEASPLVPGQIFQGRSMGILFRRQTSVKISV
jgi:hypothetical protein